MCNDQVQINHVWGTSSTTHLREVEKSWLTEQDVSQEHRATSQNFNLVFTEMMAPQEFAKVPGNQKAGGRWIVQQCGRQDGETTRGTGRALILMSKRAANINCSWKWMDRNSLLLQDSEGYRLCNDKAVWVHHAIFSTNLSYTKQKRADIFTHQDHI